MTDFELAHQDGRHAWRHLDNRLADYLAEHLPQAGYQLVRVSRGTSRDERARETVLTLMLEVGQVTERPFVHVAVAASPQAEAHAELDWHDGGFFDDSDPGVPRRANPFGLSDEEFAKRKARSNKPAPANPPPRRHILIDKQPSQAAT